MPTQRARILEYLAHLPGRDDDEIAKALGFPQRQTANRICNELAKQGFVNRVRPRGKWVNFLSTPASGREPRDLAVKTDLDEEIEPPTNDLPLTLDKIMAGGFTKIGSWGLKPTGALRLIGKAPSHRGVYVFVSAGRALYVGVASRSLRERLNFYGSPGVGQKTNLRLNGEIKAALAFGQAIDVFVASPPAMSWNGFRVDTAAGVEVGLIETFTLPWNIRGAR